MTSDLLKRDSTVFQLYNFEPLELNGYFPIKLASFGLSSFMFKEKHEYNLNVLCEAFSNNRPSSLWAMLGHVVPTVNLQPNEMTSESGLSEFKLVFGCLEHSINTVVAD